MVWNYLPSVITIVFGILWGICDVEVQRLEPYFQLYTANNSGRGASAESTVDIDYHTFWAPLRLWQAVKHRHYACVISSLAYIIAFAILPNLQNYLFSWEMYAAGSYEWSQGTYKYQLGVVDPVFARVINAMLGIEILCGISLLCIFSNRETGLYEDPKGIAALASLVKKDGWPMLGLVARTNGTVATERELRLATAGMRFITISDGVRLHLKKIHGPGAAVPQQEMSSWCPGRLKPLLARLKSSTFNGLYDRNQHLMLARLPLLIFSLVLTILLVGTSYILKQVLLNKDIKNYHILLPPNLYLVVGVFIKVSYYPAPHPISH